MSDILIRHAEPTDADALAALIRELGYPADAHDIPGRLERMTRENRAVAFVAVHGANVCGLATAHLIAQLHRVADVCWLTAIVVAKEMRGTGVGRALVRAVESFAHDAGCERLSVTTHTDMMGARAFYPSVGLPETGRRFGKSLGRGADRQSHVPTEGEDVKTSP